MRRKQAILVLLVALFLSSNVASGQDLSPGGPKKARTAEDYKPRALKEIAALSALEPASEGNSTEVVTGDLLPSRVRVTNQASKRPISRARQKIIFNWAQRYAGDPQHYTVPYQTEFLFREAGLNYWLVVNKDLVPHTATSKAGGFDSQVIQADKSWRFTVRKKGDFAYVCTFHPTMKATLRVR